MGSIPDGIVTLAELHDPGFHACEKMIAARRVGTTNVLRIDLENKGGKVIATLFSTDGSKRNVTECGFCDRNFDVTLRS